MIALATTTPGGEPQAFGLPLLTRLLPGLVSAVALLPASLALQFHGAASMLLPLLIVQGTLLALGAGLLAVAAHDCLSHWESRAAPLAARDRVRVGLLGDVWRMGAIAAAGPLALALVLAWRGDGWAAVISALTVLVACLFIGLAVALSWHGRAPRVLLAPAGLLLLGLLGALPHEGALGSGWELAPVAATAALLWRWLSSPRGLAALAPPLPWPRPIAWLRRTTAYQGWRMSIGPESIAPVRQGSHGYRFWMMLLPLLWLPQLMGQAERLRWFSWGHAFDGAYGGAIYGGCMLLITTAAASCYVAPPLHWRLRLAPGGMSPQRWARRMVLGSMAATLVLFTVALALVVLFRASGSAHLSAGTWLSLMGDALLGSSFLRWQLGRRSTVWARSLAVLAVPVLPALLLYGLLWLGVTPQRGALWLALQLALTVPMTLAAVRAWGRRDLNQVA